MRTQWIAALLPPLAIIAGGSTFLDPVDAPRFQIYGTTMVDGQRNATFSAIVGTTGSFTGPVTVANLAMLTATVSSTGNFPANTGHLFVTGTATIWLPAASSVPLGRLLMLWNVGSGTVTLSATGSDTLLVFGSASALALSKHSMLAISRTTSSWIVQVN